MKWNWTRVGLIVAVIGIGLVLVALIYTITVGLRGLKLGHPELMWASFIGGFVMAAMGWGICEIERAGFLPHQILEFL